CEPGRRTTAADLQPGWRLRELRCPGSFPADPAADAAGRRRVFDQHRADARRREAFCERSRTRHRAPDHLPACTRALSHCTAAHLWLLDAWRSAAIAGGRLGISAGDQLLSPGGPCVV